MSNNIYQNQYGDFISCVLFQRIGRLTKELHFNSFNDLNDKVFACINNLDYKNAVTYAQQGSVQYGLKGLSVYCRVLLEKIHRDMADNEIIDQDLAKLFALTGFIKNHLSPVTDETERKLERLISAQPEAKAIMMLGREQLEYLEDAYLNYIKDSL